LGSSRDQRPQELQFEDAQPEQLDPPEEEPLSPRRVAATRDSIRLGSIPPQDWHSTGASACLIDRIFENMELQSGQRYSYIGIPASSNESVHLAYSTHFDDYGQKRRDDTIRSADCIVPRIVEVIS